MSNWVLPDAKKTVYECEHNKPMIKYPDGKTRCPDCNSEFIYCNACSVEGTVYHMPPACPEIS